MSLDVIGELIETQIAKAIKDKQEETDKLRAQLLSQDDIVKNLYQEKRELKKQIDIYEIEDRAISLIRPLISEDNFIQFLDSLSIEGTNIKVDGMYSEDIPIWFEAIVKYYNHRDTVFQLMDFAGVKYPSWAKSFKMPYDCNEDEIEIFFKRFHSFGMTNSCYFEHNMGFFWRDIYKYEGNTEALLNGKSYVHIPWNLLLKNKLFTTDYFFNKILTRLSNGYPYNDLYFLRIQNYQELSEKQALKLIQCLLDNEKIPRKHVVGLTKRNCGLLEDNLSLAKEFKSEMTLSNYSQFNFYYRHYPIDMQIEFIKGIRPERALEEIKTMDLSKDEKLALMIEVAKDMLED